MRILCVGDIIGREGTVFTAANLWALRKEHGADMVICNAENCAPGNGVDVESAQKLLAAGADVLTSGNHIWQKKEIYPFLDSGSDMIRPANYPHTCPGRGYTIKNIDNYKILVINISGSIYMEPALDHPFFCADRILEREKGYYDIALLDFHAEATSEKIAMGRYLDGRIAAVWGTHTHVQTNDARIFPKGTGYVTDLGMSGPCESVIGVNIESALQKFITRMPVRFSPAEGPCEINGACFDIDIQTGKCKEAYVFKKN